MTLVDNKTGYYNMYIYRTDAGVHALCSTAHVELENRYNQIYNTSNLIAYVNRFFTRCGHTIRYLGKFLKIYVYILTFLYYILTSI